MFSTKLSLTPSSVCLSAAATGANARFLQWVYAVILGAFAIFLMYLLWRFPQPKPVADPPGNYQLG